MKLWLEEFGSTLYTINAYTESIPVPEEYLITDSVTVVTTDLPTTSLPHPVLGSMLPDVTSLHTPSLPTPSLPTPSMPHQVLGYVYSIDAYSIAATWMATSY